MQDRLPILPPQRTRRLSGLYLTGDELYALACRSFDFWFQPVLLPDGSKIFEIFHDREKIAVALSAGVAHIVIVERFKALLRGN